MNRGWRASKGHRMKPIPAAGNPVRAFNPDSVRIGQEQRGRPAETTCRWSKRVPVRGMRKLEDSVKPGNYKTLWCAGKSVEMINNILPCETIVSTLKKEFETASLHLRKTLEQVL